MTIGDSDYQILKSSLQLQKKLIQDKIAQMQMVAKAIDDTAGSIEETNSVDWNNLLNLIHLTTMENSMKMQYLNAGNISARINLHTLFSVNKNGWFNWIFEQTFGDLYAQQMKVAKYLDDANKSKLSFNAEVTETIKTTISNDESQLSMSDKDYIIHHYHHY